MPNAECRVANSLRFYSLLALALALPRTAGSAPLVPAACPGGALAQRLTLRWPKGMFGRYHSLEAQTRPGGLSGNLLVTDGFGISNARHKVEILLPAATYDAQILVGDLDLNPGASVAATTWPSGILRHRANHEDNRDPSITPSGERYSSTFLTGKERRIRFEYIDTPYFQLKPTRETILSPEVLITCRNPPIDTATQIEPDTYVFAVLVGTGDVQKVRITNNATLARDWVIWIGSETQPSPFSARLYARRVDSPGTLDSTTIQTANSTIFRNVPPGVDIEVGVVSTNGAGVAYLRAAPVMRSLPTLRAGFDFVTTATDLADARAALSAAQRTWWAISGGRLLIQTIALTPRASNGACLCFNGPCDVCFRNVAGRSFADPWQVTMFRPWNPWTMSHELGHHPLDALDEYEDHYGPAGICHSDFQCTNSIMGSRNLKLCSQRNHAQITSTWPTMHVGDGWEVSGSCTTTNVTPTTPWASLWEYYGLGPELGHDVDVRDFTALDPGFFAHNLLISTTPPK